MRRTYKNRLIKWLFPIKPDIIIFPSMYHGGLVQSNWAYSCRSFFVSSCGINDLPSEIRNPLGEVISSSTNYFHYVVASVNLDCRLAHLDYNWAKLLALKEKYGKRDADRWITIKKSIKQKEPNAIFMIYSETGYTKGTKERLKENGVLILKNECSEK